MNVLECHGRLAQLSDAALRKLMPEDCALPVDGEVVLPLVVTAAASLSGMLDDATSNDDIVQACSHFASLFSAEILGPDELNDETARVFGVLQRACEPQAKREDQAAMLN